MLTIALSAALPSLDDMCADWQDAAAIETRPPLSSRLGGALAGSDVLSLGAVTFPPFVVGTSSFATFSPPFDDPLRPNHPEPGEPDPLTGYTGRLLVGGALVATQRSRWCAHRVEREGRAGGDTPLRVRTSVSMDGLTRAIFFEATVEPAAQVAAAAEVEVQVELQGIVRQFGPDAGWEFGHPTVLKNETAELDVAPLNATGGGYDGVLVRDPRSAAACAVVLASPVAALELRPALNGSTTLVGARATYRASPPFTVRFVLAVADDADAAARAARSLAGGFDAARAAAAAHWEGRWSDAFAAGNAQYSGHLPTLEGDADVGRTYYLSALSLLSMEKRVDHAGVAWQQAHT